MEKKTILNTTFAVLILVLSACGDKGDRAIDEPSADSVKSDITFTIDE